MSLSPPARTSTRARFALALTLLVAFAIYAPSLGNRFAMDDRFIAMPVLDDGRPNPFVDELLPVGAYFSSHYWAATKPQDGDLYRPVTVLSYALVQRFLVPEGATEGRQALPQHAANVVLHVFAAWLVWALARRLGCGPTAATLGALVFGLHAVHSEVVASVVGRAELFAFVFGMLAVLVWVRAFDRSAGFARIAELALVAALLFLAFGSKESALAWVPFLPVVHLVREIRRAREAGGAGDRKSIGRELWRGTIRAAVVAALPLAAYLALRHRTLEALTGSREVVFLVNPLWHADAFARIATAIRIWGYALRLTVLPWPLAADYGFATFDEVRSVLDPGFLVASLGLGALLVAGIAGMHRQPMFFLAVATFLGFGFLTSNVPFAIGTIFGERLLYTPSLGLSFLVAAAADRVVGWRPLLAGALGAWLGASALAIVVRNPVWQDDASLFLSEARVQPRSTRMLLCEATVRSERGESRAALRLLERAVELDPDYALAWNNQAAIHLDLGNLVEAEYCIDRGLRARHVVGPDDLFKLHCNLGLVLGRTGRDVESMRQFERSLELEPDFLRARYELLRFPPELLSDDRYEAILAEGERRAPRDAHWIVFRGILAHRRGEWQEAVDVLDRAFMASSWPTRAPLDLARLVLGDSLSHVGRRDEALAVFDRLAIDATASADARQRARLLAGQIRAGGA